MQAILSSSIKMHSESRYNEKREFYPLYSPLLAKSKTDREGDIAEMDAYLHENPCLPRFVSLSHNNLIRQILYEGSV